MTPDQVLALPLSGNAASDSDAVTIMGYLNKLLLQVWTEGEMFSGKRPFGNSGWDWDLLITLAENDAIEGTNDEGDWDFTAEQQQEGFDLITSAIRYMGE